MKILFVLGSVYPDGGANSIIVNELVKIIQRKNITVDVLGKATIDNSPEFETNNNVNIHRLYIEPPNRYSNNLKKELNTLSKDSNKLLKALKLLRKPFMLIEYLKKRYSVEDSIEYYSNQYRDKVEQLNANNSYDLIVSISAPFYASYGVAKAQVDVPFIYYQLDPFYSHYNYTKSRNSLKYEEYVCEKSSFIIMNDLIFEDYKQCPLKRYLRKTKVLNFPSIKPIAIDSSKNEIIFNDNYINLVYVGSLYPDIRSPEYLYKLLHKTENKKLNYKIHIIGYDSSCFSEEFVQKYQAPLGNKLILYNRVNSIEAFNAMLKADILINIGNTIQNQMPSKIFDYISTGKPIINFCKLDNCPTLKYTKRYPVCLNIFESKGITDDLINGFSKFCIENKGRQIDFHEIESLYNDCTAEAVGIQFMNIIYEIVNRDNQ